MANGNGQFLGPFLGLNDTLTPKQLPIQFARRAHNVVLTDNRIRPLPPLVDLNAGEDEQVPVGRVLSMFVTDDNDNRDEPIVYVKSVNSFDTPDGPVLQGTLSYFTENTAFRGHMTGDLSLYPADFVQVGQWIYVLDGGARLYKVKGREVRKVGLTVPTTEHVTAALVNTGGSVNADVSYKITYYDEPTLVESNGLLTDEFAASNPNAVRFNFARGVIAALGETFTHVRIYRRNHTLNQIAWRLIAHLPRETLPLTVDDNAPGDTVEAELAGITLSSPTDGPFAPSRNGIPSHASCGCVYRKRLLVNDTRNPGIVRYSAVGEPDHFDPVDQIDVSGDQFEYVSALISIGDQVFAGKRRNIWGISGEIAGASNLTNAQGDTPPESTVRSYRTTSPVGPVQRYGNGFILAGEPGSPHFASDQGFFRFNGLDSLILSKWITNSWDAFVRNSSGECFSYAYDAHLGTIYITTPWYSSGGVPDIPVPGLVYHVPRGGAAGVGAWSTFDAQPLGLVTCVATGYGRKFSNASGEPVDRTPIRSIAMGTTSAGDVGGVFLTESGEVRDAGEMGRIPDFEYVTGDLPVHRGRKGHLYYMKFFLGGPPAIPVVGAARFLLQVISEGGTDGEDVDAVGESFRRVHVGREAEFFAVSIKKSESWEKGWDENLAVLGWEPDVVPVGSI